MNASTAVWLVAGLLLAPAPSLLHAQHVGADFAVRTGPVVGHVVVGDAFGYSTYRRPAPRRVVVIERYAPSVIVVERVRTWHPRRHWQHRGYRLVTLYYVDGRYYDRELPRRRPARAVVVYERGGRYYSDCDPDHWDRYHDRWDE